jgi:hypothetical protein
MVQLENKFTRYAKSQSQLHSAMKHAGDESGDGCWAVWESFVGIDKIATKDQHGRIKSEKSPKAATTMRPCRHHRDHLTKQPCVAKEAS